MLEEHANIAPFILKPPLGEGAIFSIQLNLRNGHKIPTQFYFFDDFGYTKIENDDIPFQKFV